MRRLAAWLWPLAMALASSTPAEEMPTPEPGLAAPTQAQTTAEASVAPDEGRATWYGGKRWHGRLTASGERFDQHALTAAHRTLPLGSWVRVVNLTNGRQVHVRINDRGPRSQRFVIDLSEAAAEHLGFRRQGSALVQLQPAANPTVEQTATPSF